MDDKKAELQFSLDRYLLAEQILTLNVSDGSMSQSFSNDDFKSRESPTTGELATPIIETSTDGKLTVEFNLLDTETN